MKKIKTILLTITLLLGSFTQNFARPDPLDEGMWLLHLLKELNIKTMQKKGLKLSAEDIYSVNKASLKDAVVSFGGFCTGEIISDKGLILTNHHCGYGSIQTHSSVEKDYLTNGFWAMDKSQELKNENLTATFIVRVEDVSSQVLEGTKGLSESEREDKIKARITEISEKATEGTHYKAVIKPFFYGNEYYMFITETFTDIRLVGAPPSSIGKFGGDTDNWVWPRHTGDFSLFRIYAGKDNKPAAYSPDNVPYKPKHFLPISLKGISKNDFTMIMGFPGRTQEYITSYAVKQLMQTTNPHRIKLRTGILDIYNKYMSSSDKVRIQYSSKQAGVANAWKKWIGQNRGLKKLDAIEKKEALEAKFRTWAKAKSDRKEYVGLLDKFKKNYQDLEKVSLAFTYINEAVFGTELIPFAYSLSRFVSQNKKGISEENYKSTEKSIEKHFKDYYAPLDKEVFLLCMQSYYDNLPKEFHPDFFNKISSEYKGSFEAFAKFVFESSNLVSKEKTLALLKKAKKEGVQVIEDDIAYRMMREFLEVYFSKILPTRQVANNLIELNQRSYMQGLRAMQSDKTFYPDANSTMRLSFGQVQDYFPKDGVYYDYYTTLEGIMEKARQTDVLDYIIPQKLRTLYQNKDYGQYGKNGQLNVCFIASNHTTGGNSGSPVMNAEGHLIGINFDRNWEGTMSDIMYDPDQVRNISVDVRYILFVIDKLAGAGHLIKEMKLIK